MGKVLLEEQSLIDIANSIRNKTGSNNTMKPSEMAGNIDSIESGGGDLSEYFNTNPETFTSTSSNPFMLKSYFFNMPDLVIPDDVTKISYLFAYSSTNTKYNLEIAPKIIFNNNITNISYAFAYLSTDIELDLSGCNTENVTNMSYCFKGCEEITKLNLSNFNTNKTNSFLEMFSNCKKIKNLDLSNFYTNVATNMAYMFTRCISLEFLDIRNFDFTNVTSYTDMFGSSANFGVPDDCLIIVKDEIAKEWITSKFTRLTNVKTIAEYESGV